MPIARGEKKHAVGDWSTRGKRGAYNDALDVDVVFSASFNALPIRRLGLHERVEEIILSMVYARVPELPVAADTVSYTSSIHLDGIKLRSPVRNTIVDADAFIMDYPGLAERI
nr:putative glycolipid-binding domain-containing protein [Mycobacterium leprae]